jgi:uncharacterized protein (DUF2141 family)
MHRITIGLLGLLSVSAHAGQTGTITVVTTGLENEKGSVLVQLANSATDYKEDDDAFRYAQGKPQGGRATFTFENVPYGAYAIKAFHDENDNRKIDFGWRGPTERYGFSNGARGRMGPPKFDEAKFTLSQSTLQLEINLK